MPVEVFVDAFPESVYTGTFSEIDTMPNHGGEFGGGGGSYKAKVVFQKTNPEERILGGMSANVQIMLNQVKDAIVIPNPAIVDNQQGQKVVRLQQANGEWKDQVIEIGIADDINTVVLSGLKVGEVIKGLYITEDAMKNAGIGKEGDEEVYMDYGF